MSLKKVCNTASRLLSLGEAALLYPGGAREAMKGKGEKYKLFWPKRQEFVRMAARFGATIVPFAAVGAEDAFNLVTDSSDLLRTPILGELIRRGFAAGGGRSKRQVIMES
jgi:1-acyl-sn-glycerol-3-phosphate acyltransferase